MPQQQSPFLEGKYGWNFGEGGWNTGMDENLLKFSYMFDRNVDGIVSSLPAAVNGQAYFLTSDSRLYFAVGTTWYSSPVPKWFEFKIRSTGDVYQFNGTAAVQIESPAGIDARLDAVELTLSTLGTAAFEDVDFFATQAELDVVQASVENSLETFTSDLLDYSDTSKGASLVGWKRNPVSDTITTVAQMLNTHAISLWEYASAVVSKPTPADPSTWDWYPAFEAARNYFDANGGALHIPAGLFKTSNEVKLSNNTKYFCDGTIQLTAATSGGALLAPYGTSNIVWEGGILDCNNIAGQNAVGLAGGGSFPSVNNALFRGITCKNAKWDATILGGKGFTMHQACRAVRFLDMVVEDCDIGFSVEGFDGRETSGNIIDGVVVRRALRTGAWLYQGGIIAVDDPNNYSCLIDNVVFEDCAPDTGFGVISADRANGIKMRAFINNYSATSAITPFKGTITNSRLEIDVDAASVVDLMDFRVITGGLSTADSYNISADFRFVSRSAGTGYLVHYAPGQNDLTKADIKVAFDGFTGTGLMSAVNSAIFFDFIRLSDCFRVYGRAEDGVAPTFSATFREKLGSSLATSGVILSRSSGNLVGVIRAAVAGDQLDLQDAAGSVMVRTKEPASGEVGLLVRNNNGSARLSQVTLGAADSGGTGFKVLRVPN